MGTFHDDKGELHGITVVVDTATSEIFVGRCHEATDQHVILLDADSHTDGAEGKSKADWVKQAARWGVFPKHKSLNLPRKAVTDIKPLSQAAS